jgi:hypothetical protein
MKPNGIQKFVFSITGNKEVVGDHVREGEKATWDRGTFLEEVKL